VDFRSRANTAMWLDLGHMTRGEHTWEVWGYVRNTLNFCHHLPTIPFYYYSGRYVISSHTALGLICETNRVCRSDSGMSHLRVGYKRQHLSVLNSKAVFFWWDWDIFLFWLMSVCLFICLWDNLLHGKLAISS
jgi:hypothetical protein